MHTPGAFTGENQHSFWSSKATIRKVLQLLLGKRKVVTKAEMECKMTLYCFDSGITVQTVLVWNLMKSDLIKAWFIFIDYWSPGFLVFFLLCFRCYFYFILNFFAFRIDWRPSYLGFPLVFRPIRFHRFLSIAFSFPGKFLNNYQILNKYDIWASSRQNLPSGFATRVDSNRPAQPRKLGRGLKFRI